MYTRLSRKLDLSSRFFTLIGFHNTINKFTKVFSLTLFTSPRGNHHANQVFPNENGVDKTLKSQKRWSTRFRHSVTFTTAIDMFHDRILVILLNSWLQFSFIARKPSSSQLPRMITLWITLSGSINSNLDQHQRLNKIICYYLIISFFKV